MVNQDDIREAMKQVDDPELGINVVDLGLLYEVIVDEATGKVDLNMTLTSMGCPLTEQIIADVRSRGDAAVLELTARFDGLQAAGMAAALASGPRSSTTEAFRQLG